VRAMERDRPCPGTVLGSAGWTATDWPGLSFDAASFERCWALHELLCQPPLLIGASTAIRPVSCSESMTRHLVSRQTKPSLRGQGGVSFHLGLGLLELGRGDRLERVVAKEGIAGQIRPLNVPPGPADSQNACVFGGRK